MLGAQPFFIAAFIAVSVQMLLIISSGDAAVMEVAKVKCILTINFTDDFDKAHHTCRETRMEENKDKKEKHNRPPPWNTTIEDFEFDDKCDAHCVYKTVGILSDDETLPDKKDTSVILTKGKIKDDHYNAVIAVWDECLEISAGIGKKKSWDNCKTVTHHSHCFMKKMHETIDKTQVDC